ncbi:MAG: ribonuclease D [Woeseiaceae bacterium]|nr:ribonuclease D [Woeseiaceae bacterium]
MSDYQLVDLTIDESQVLETASESRIGIDTEFMREKTFFAELCLMQVSTPDNIFCADPLGAQGNGEAREEFWTTITQPEWVLHAGRQDLEVIYQTSGKMPSSIFDTQIAAAFLGLQPQIGYAGLVKELFSQELDKAHTRADWSKRPIGDALLRYAAEDVQYLLPAYDELKTRLDKLGRLEWVLADSRDLLDVRLYENDPSLAIERLKGARNLRGRSRAAAAALASWRESEALRRNRPRQWIIRDNALINIAINAPESKSALMQVDSLSEKMVHRLGGDILQILADATHDTSGYEPPRRPNEAEKAALKEMQRKVAAVSEELGLAAELLAPKKELSAMMLGNRESRVLNGWRRELIGDHLLGLL